MLSPLADQDDDHSGHATGNHCGDDQDHAQRDRCRGRCDACLRCVGGQCPIIGEGTVALSSCAADNVAVIQSASGTIARRQHLHDVNIDAAL